MLEGSDAQSKNSQVPYYLIMTAFRAIKSLSFRNPHISRSDSP